MEGEACVIRGGLQQVGERWFGMSRACRLGRLVQF